MQIFWCVSQWWHLIMAAPCNRTGHYIFALWFLSFFFFYLFSSPNLSGRRLDVYHILPHIVWPYCEFSMQVWNVLHDARWKYRRQKSPFWHHRIASLSRYIFGGMYQQSEKNLLNSDTSSTCADNMVNVGLLVIFISPYNGSKRRRKIT